MEAHCGAAQYQRSANEDKKKGLEAQAPLEFFFGLRRDEKGLFVLASFDEVAVALIGRVGIFGARAEHMGGAAGGQAKFCEAVCMVSKIHADTVRADRDPEHLHLLGDRQPIVHYLCSGNVGGLER